MTSTDNQAQEGLGALRSKGVGGYARVSYDTPFGRITRCVPFGKRNADTASEMRRRLHEMRTQLEQRKGEE